MRFTFARLTQWTKRTNAAATTAAAVPQFVVRDFVKLVAYAVVSGIAFSALAIGVTLAVSRDSEAQTNAARFVAEPVAEVGMIVLAGEVRASKVDAVVVAGTNDLAESDLGSEISPAPGSLYIGEGCGAEELSAIEREWYVLIDNGIATVQVMQTFVLPEQTERMARSANEATSADELHETESDAPSFSARLPMGAAFLSMNVDTSKSRLYAKPVAVNENDDQDYTTIQRLMREAQTRGELPVYLDQINGAPFISSAQMFDFRAGETIVVTYRYRIAIAQHNGRSQLTLPLEALPTDADEASANVAPAASAASGTVWVEWKTPKAAPRTFDVLPSGATVEQSRGRIAGLNWATSQITPGEKFVLGWR